MHEIIGKKVKDTVTESVGKVTGRVEYATGNPQVYVESIDTTGRPIQWWVDESRVEVVE